MICELRRQSGHAAHGSAASFGGSLAFECVDRPPAGAGTSAQRETKLTWLSIQYQLEPAEVSKLRAAVSAIPADEWGQVVREELEDILAARRMTLLRPVTLADLEAVRARAQDG